MRVTGVTNRERRVVNRRRFCHSWEVPEKAIKTASLPEHLICQVAAGSRRKFWDINFLVGPADL